MNLSEVNIELDHKIVSGSEYQWECYGPNARFLDYESDFGHATVVYDTVTQNVYEATVNDKDDKLKPYRWHDPDTKDLYLAECKEKSIDPINAWDDTNWCDLEVPEDWLSKAGAIMRGESFDTRITVPLDLNRDELFRLMELAHERDITLNKLVENILWDVINAKKKNSTLD